MDEKRVIKEVKRIKKKINSVKALTIILIIVSVFLPIEPVFKVALIFAIIFFVLFIISKIRSSFFPILFDECDAKTFYGVCRGIYPQGSAVVYEALAGFFIGDFEGSVKLAASALNMKQTAFSHFELTSLIADNAFDAGDFEMCEHFCNEARELLGKIRLKDELKRRYISSFDYYKAFIAGDYVAATACFEGQESTLKNSSKLMRCYYRALAYYYNGDTERAVGLFEEIVNAAPKFFITSKAEQYLNAVKNNTFLEISSCSLGNAYEQGRVPSQNTPVNKSKQIRSVIVMIILAVITVVGFLHIPGIETGTAYDVISSEAEVNEICKILPIDEKYTLCIFDDEYDGIGVAYLKNKGEDKYTYCCLCVISPDHNISDDNGYYMYASGNTQKVYFDITDNADMIPDGSRITEFESKGKTYYFYITKTELKYNFVNASGTVL